MSKEETKAAVEEELSNVLDKSIIEIIKFSKSGIVTTENVSSMQTSVLILLLQKFTSAVQEVLACMAMATKEQVDLLVEPANQIKESFELCAAEIDLRMPVKD